MTAVLLTALGIASGCDKTGDYQAVNHYLSSPEDLQAVRSAVLIDLAAEGSNIRIAPAYTEELCKAVQNQRLFRVELIHGDNPICQDLPLYKRSAYSLQELADIRRALGADAILIGKISKFQPYPRMQVAVYAQLFDLKEGNLVWAVYEVWDTTDKKTAARIRDYFRKDMRQGYDPYDWELAMVSPRIFAKFVASEIAHTLHRPQKEDKP